MYSLIEMSMFRKVDTKLPVNLWIDEDGERNPEHNLSRLKFQNNTSDRFTGRKDLIPISVDENPKILLKKFNPKITAKELQAVQDFISKNREIILKYMNDPQFGQGDFLAAMKTV